MSNVFFYNSTLFALSAKVKNNAQFLNIEEKEWLLKKDEPIKVGITQIPNQVLKTKDGYKGYSIDLLNKISSLIHVPIKYIYYNSWQELLSAAKNREVDVVFLAQKTAKRLHYFNFTDIVLIQKNKILSTLKRYSQTDIEELFGKKVAVVKGSAIEEFIQLNYPQIVLITTKNEPEALNKLLNKEVLYSIVEPVRTSYYMKQNNIDNLYITGEFPYDYKLHIATRNDQPTLNIILNKALEQIPANEKKALALKWGYEKELFFDKKLLINIAVLFLVILLFLFYLSLLNKKLRAAQKSLTRINATLEQRVHEEVEKNRQKDLALLSQSRYAQMGQVINMIAHQWRQPLNSLSLIMQTLVLKCKKGNISQETLEDLKKKSFLQIEHMSDTINDFRNFFKQQKEKTHFNLNQNLTMLMNIVEPVLEKSHIKLHIDLHEELIVNGFSNELSQAILNIIYNAKDALIQNQDKSNRHIYIHLDKEENNAILEICDNAGGIPQEIIESVFAAYFSTKGDSGTGLGLYMSKLIIEQHMNGKLLAYNKNSGAVFEIRLPLV